MKRRYLLAILIIILAGCGGSFSADGGQCEQGICVQIEAVEPILWGEPVTVKISAKTDKEITDLGISIFVMPYNSVVVEGPENWEKETKDGAVFEGGGGWRITTKANQLNTFTRKVYLPPKEGSFEISASATTLQGMRVTNNVRILLTRKGGVVAPPYKRDSRTPTLVAIEPNKFTGGYKCIHEPCLTITISEPVRWGEPVKANLQILGYNDFPELGITFDSNNPSVRITSDKGDFKDRMTWYSGVWWLTDVFTNKPQDFTFLVTFPTQEGTYYLHAEAYDLAMGIISNNDVGIHLSREGGKVYYISLGTPMPEWLYTATPQPTPLFAETEEPYQTPTPEVYPPPQEPALLSIPPVEAYPPPEEPALLSSPTPEVSPSPEAPLPSSTPTLTATVTP